MFTAVHSHSPLSGLLMADDSGINRYPAGYSPEPDGSGDKIHRYSIASKSLSFYIIRNKTERIPHCTRFSPTDREKRVLQRIRSFSICFLIFSNLLHPFLLRFFLPVPGTDLRPAPPPGFESQAPCRFYGSAPVLNHPAVRMPDQCFL